MAVSFVGNTVRRSLFSRRLRVWYHPAYRLPLAGLESNQGIEPRRADLVRWYALDEGILAPRHFRSPHAVGYADLSRVHPPEFLESLSNPETLARIFAVPSGDVPVDEVMRTIRLAVGGTLEATRHALEHQTHAMNLLGGFHHAAPTRGGGLCPVNDIAVAIATVREEGLRGKVAILDLDAHPPDGLSAALGDDDSVWMGSVSGSDWGPLPGVQEVHLPELTQDDAYLRALSGLLARMPKAALCFVIAGGDVLKGDRMGRLGLSLAGAQRRDWLVAGQLQRTPTVWLPGGGYHRDSWRVLAGTLRVLALHSMRGVRPDYEPLRSRFAFISDRLPEERLHGDGFFSADDVDELFGGPPKRRRLLGYYTREGIEYALYRYGITNHLTRLGYTGVRASIEPASSGERLRVYGTYRGHEYVVVEMVLSRDALDGEAALFVNWLELMHPAAQFHPSRPQLPGQKHPGLGLSREATELLAIVARRLNLGAIVFRPAHFHVAYGARKEFQFVDPERQGRFLALLRDLSGMPLLEATRAVASGRVFLDGKPYAWEADDMVYWLDGREREDPTVTAVKDRTHFTVVV